LAVVAVKKSGLLLELRQMGGERRRGITEDRNVKSGGLPARIAKLLAGGANSFFKIFGGISDRIANRF
jgi:hypothetical protein